MPRFLGLGFMLINGTAYQGVANARNRQDVARVGHIRLDLLAQVADMGFDEAGITIVSQTPYMRNNLIMGANVVCVHCKEMEQFALRGRQAGSLPEHAHFIMQ